jgi:hypothetical protein
MTASQLLCWVSAAAPLSLVDTANGREAVRLTDVQLDKVTAGADSSQGPLIASFVSQGNKGGGVSMFSPAITILVRIITNLNMRALCDDPDPPMSL